MSSSHYLKTELFNKHYQESLEKGEPTKDLINDFKMIADNLYITITKGLFHHDGDACKSYAVSEAWIKWKKFDKNKSKNIFAFFTQMIKNDIMTHYNHLNNGSMRNISISLFEEGTEKEE